MSRSHCMTPESGARFASQPRRCRRNRGMFTSWSGSGACEGRHRGCTAASVPSAVRSAQTRPYAQVVIERAPWRTMPSWIDRSPWRAGSVRDPGRKVHRPQAVREPHLFRQPDAPEASSLAKDGDRRQSCSRDAPCRPCDRRTSGALESRRRPLALGLGMLSTPLSASSHAGQNPTGRSPATATFASSARPTRPSVPSSNSRPTRVTP